MPAWHLAVNDTVVVTRRCLAGHDLHRDFSVLYVCTRVCCQKPVDPIELNQLLVQQVQRVASDVCAQRNIIDVVKAATTNERRTRHVDVTLLR